MMSPTYFITFKEEKHRQVEDPENIRKIDSIIKQKYYLVLILQVLITLITCKCQTEKLPHPSG